MQFNIQIVGGEIVIANLRRLGNDGVLSAADTSMADFAQHVAEELRNTPYPPELDNQKYKRTMRFRDSWKYEKRGKAEHVVVNDATDKRGRIYPGYVTGRDPDDKTTQAYMHVGRWWLARDIVDEMENQLADEVLRAIQRLIP